MAKLTAEVVELYIERYGWTFRRGGEGVWYSGWSGDHRSFPLTMKLTDTWLGFKVSPLFSLEIDWDCWPELSRFLLELNHECKLVKIGINARSEIAISFEFFSEEVTFDDFSDALGIIGHYAEILHEEISSWLNEIGYFTGTRATYIT